MSDALTKALASLGHPNLPKPPPKAEHQWPTNPSPEEASWARQGEAQRIRAEGKVLPRHSDFEDFTPLSPEAPIIEGPYDLED